MRHHVGSLLGLTSLFLAAGCTSASFDVASSADDAGGDTSTGDGGTGSDTGATGDSASIDSADIDAADAGGIDTSVPPADGGPPIEGGPTCVPLAAGATDVYVDKRFAGGSSNGTDGCPFTTITAALAVAGGFSGTRTIHVAGGVVPVIYNEPSSILVNHNIVLLGDGPAKTTINASGPCGSSTCAVQVNSSGTLDGFTVVSASGDGILASAGSPAPIVRNVNANGSKMNGINVLGSIELGPNVSANRNALQGVVSGGSGTVHVIAATGAPNTFDNNGANGIDIEGNATLKFEGGSATLNAFNGVRLSWTAPTLGTGPVHTITGLFASANKNNGLAAYNAQNLKLRASKFVTNANYGLYYAYAGTSVLDVGLTTDPGGNTFGTNTVATRNTKSGIYLCKSRGPASQPAEGNSWSGCPPTQVSLAGCDTAPGAYADIAYAPAVAGDPVAVASCTSGP